MTGPGWRGARDRIVASPRFEAWRDRLASHAPDPVAWKSTMKALAAEVEAAVAADPGAGGHVRKITTGLMEALSRLVPAPREFPRLELPEPPARSEADLFDLVVDHFPTPIAGPYAAFAGRPFLGTLLDTFEALVHYLAVVALAGYLRDGAFNPAHNQRLLEMIVPQAQWTSGRLLEILRDTVALYRRRPQDLAYPHLHAYLFDARGKPTRSAESLAGLIRLRNDEWGHKGGRDEAHMQRLLPGAQETLERELNHCHWLAEQVLVVPTEVDPDGTITRARRMKGHVPRPPLPFRCAPGPRGGGREAPPGLAVVLCGPARDEYLPLFPLSLFPSGRGVFLLAALQWKSAAERLRLARFVRYHEGSDSQHEEHEGEATTRALEAGVGLLRARLSRGAAGIEGRAEGHVERITFDLPEVARHRAALAETFVGREDVLADIVARVGPQALHHGRVILLAGGEGQGKSALVSVLAKRLEADGVPCLLHMVACHREPRRFLQFLVGTGLRLLGAPCDPSLARADVEDLRNALVDLIDRLGRARGGALLAIDGLDALDERDRRLAFLPSRLPPTCTLLVTGRPHEGIAGSLRGLYPHLDRVDLAGMSRQDVRLLAEQRLGLPADVEQGIEGAVDLDDLLARSDGCPFLLELHLAACRRELERHGRPHALPAPLRVHDLPSTTDAWFNERYRELAGKGPDGYATRKGRIQARLLHLLAVARGPLSLEDLAGLLALAGLPDEPDGSPAPALPLEEVRDRIAPLASWLDCDESGRFRMGRSSFAEHVRSQVLGAAETATLHGVFCRLLDAGPQATRPYRISHHAGHLLQWAQAAPGPAGARLESLLQDFAYLRARVEAHAVFELLADFEEARRFCTDPGVVAWHRFLDRHAHELARDPHRLHPAALDLPPEDPVARCAEAVPPSMPVLRRLNRPRQDEAGSFLRAVGGHGRPVRAVTMAPDGRLGASGDGTGAVRLWEVDTGRDRLALPTRAGAIGVLAFSEDGLRVAAGTDDGRIHVWRVSDGTPAAPPLDAHGSPVRGLWLVEDARLLLSTDQRGGARLWDPEAGRLLADLPPACDGTVSFTLPDGPAALAWAPADTLRLETPTARSFFPRQPWTAVAQEERLAVQCGDEGEIGTCALGSHAEQGVVGHCPSRATRVAVDEDGRLAITAHEDGTLRTWDLAGRHALAVLAAHRGPVHDVALHAGSLRALSAGEDGTVRVWDLARRPDGVGLRPHGAPVIRSWIAPDATAALTLAADGSLRAWDPRSGDARGRWIAPGPPVTDAAACWRSGRVAVGTGDGGVTVVDGGALVSPGPAREGDPARVECVAFSRDGHRVCVGMADGSVREWPPREGGLHASVSPAVPRALAAFPEDDRLAVGCSDGSIRLLSTRQGEEALRLSGHDDAVRAVVITAGGMGVSAADDGTIRAWSGADGRLLHVFDTGVVHRPVAVAVSPNGRRVVAGCADNVLRAWSLETGARAWEAVGHEGDILAVDWSPDRKRIVTGGADGTCRTWDAATGRALACYPARAEVRACSMAGESVVCGDDAGSVYLLRLEGAGSQPSHPVRHAPSTLREAALKGASPVLRLASAPGSGPAGGASKRRVEGIRLDHHQNRVLKAMREGPFLVEGMAGSGKTLVLLQYAVLAARHHVPARRVLFVCYNLALSRYVADLLDMNVEAKVRERITVRAFYDLCGGLAGREVDHAAPDRAYYHDLLASASLGARRLREEERFDTIIVDEGQDLSDAMFDLLVGLRRGRSRDFKVAEDGTQNLFRHRKPGSEHAWGRGTWALSIARTHRRTLYASHRSSPPVLEYAFSLLGSEPPRPDGSKGDEPQLPFLMRREGTAPVEKCLTVDAMLRFLGRSIAREMKEEAPAEIGILYTRDLDTDAREVRALASRIAEELERQGLPVDFFSEDPRAKLSFRIEAPTVKLGSVQAAKGLDFRVVYLLDLVTSPAAEGIRPSARALDPRQATTLFVGATRARDVLYVITSLVPAGS